MSNPYTGIGTPSTRLEFNQRPQENGVPVQNPSNASYIHEHNNSVGFIGASSIERFAVESSITELARQFKSIPVKRIT